MSVPFGGGNKRKPQVRKPRSAGFTQLRSWVRIAAPTRKFLKRACIDAISVSTADDRSRPLRATACGTPHPPIAFVRM